MIAEIAQWVVLGVLLLATGWHRYRLGQHDGTLRSIRGSINLHMRNHNRGPLAMDARTRPLPGERRDGG